MAGLFRAGDARFDLVREREEVLRRGELFDQALIEIRIFVGDAAAK